MPWLVATTVLLRVGILLDAGDVRAIAADGAAGQCTTGPAWLACPATEPVTFRWGPGDASGWALTGDVTLQPGDEGIAWVLATDDRVRGAHVDLSGDDVTAEAVRTWFIREGDRHPPAPSARTLADLVALAGHPDKAVRREVVDALHPWLWRSRLGPLPPDAPIPIPAGVIASLAADADKVVRRRIAVILRDARPSHLDDEIDEALTTLADDPIPGVRKTALASASWRAVAGDTDVEAVWSRAMGTLPQPGPPGRGAAGTLARLATVTGPTEVVDPAAAVRATLTWQPERAWSVWSAWRDHVPFDPELAGQLLRGTVGMNGRLVKAWAATHPQALSVTLRTWEPIGPHSDRFELVRRALEDTTHPELRAALGLPPLQ